MPRTEVHAPILLLPLSTVWHSQLLTLAMTTVKQLWLQSRADQSKLQKSSSPLTAQDAQSGSSDDETVDDKPDVSDQHTKEDNNETRKIKRSAGNISFVDLKCT